MNHESTDRPEIDSFDNSFQRTSPSIAKLAATAASRLIVISLAAVFIWSIASPPPAFAAVVDEAALADKNIDPAPPVANPSDPALQQLEIQRDVLQKRLALANEDIEKQLREFDKLDTDNADLTTMESQLDDLRAIIKRVGTQLALWNIELEAEQRIKVMDVASRPEGEDSLTRDLGIGIAGLVGFLATFITVGLFILLITRSPWRSSTRALGAGILVGALSAFVVGVLVPVRYEAQATIKVSKIIPVVLQNVMNGGADEGASYDVYKKTQMQLLKSYFVLSRAARKSEMRTLTTMKEHNDDPVGFLERNLIVDYPGGAELMRVAIKGTRRDELPIIVNAVVDAYMDEIVSGDKVARLKQKDLLAQNYSANQEAYRQKADKYKKLARELGASSSESARLRKKLAEQRLESMVASADALRQQIRDVEAQISVLKERNVKATGGA